MDDIITYEIVVDYEDDTTRMVRNSFVADPAVEINKFTFSKPKEPIKLIFNNDDNNQSFMSVSILADTPIPRIDENGEPFNVVFTKDTVRKIANKLSMEGRGNEVSWQHTDQIIDGVYLVEQFIFEKNRVYSPVFKDIPEGSLIQTYWVKDKDLFNKLANDVNFGGFSIEIEAKIREMAFTQVKEENLLEDIYSILNNETLLKDQKYDRIKEIVVKINTK